VTIGTAPPLDSDERMTMDPIVFCLGYLDSKKLVVRVGAGQQEWVHRAIKKLAHNRHFRHERPAAAAEGRPLGGTSSGASAGLARRCGGPGI
jgi:hypothetical protein